MKTLLITLLLGFSLIFTGCPEKKDQVKEDDKLTEPKEDAKEDVVIKEVEQKEKKEDKKEQ